MAKVTERKSASHIKTYEYTQDELIGILGIEPPADGYNRAIYIIDDHYRGYGHSDDHGNIRVVYSKNS